MFSIYQILLGWETYKYYYETDELPYPRPTQNQEKNRLVAFGALFSRSKYFFEGWGWFFIGNRLQGTQPNQIIFKHPTITGVRINQDQMGLVKIV